jgi:branched-chain amino acid transport system permease protein
MQTLVSSLPLGAVYAVIAIGFVVLFRATGVLNFAQGAFMVIGAQVAYVVSVERGYGIAWGLVAAVAVTSLLAALVYRAVFSRMLGASALSLSVATLGVGIVVGKAAAIWAGGSTRTFSEAFTNSRVDLPGSTYTTQAEILAFCLSLAVTALILGLIRFTKTGTQMRAVADGDVLASYQGIRVRRVVTIAWALAGASAAVAGVVFSVQNGFTPTTLPGIGLLVFPAIVLGGTDSMAGAVVGGMITALVQNYVARYLGGEWREAVAYGLLLAFLIFRPNGLFGSRQVVRI